MHASVESAVAAELLRCVACGVEVSAGAVRKARIRSNVKSFAHEAFGVWRCEGCGSVHAADAVDLAPYYARYPLLEQRLGFATRWLHRSRVRALRKLGLAREQRVLDFGCGAGLLVQHLRERGFRHARGYDPYAKQGPFAEPPGSGYDLVVSQDVIQHIADPLEHLRDLMALTKPGGLLVVGTPDAAAIDLTQPEKYIHMLHQPYHRHILSGAALRALAQSLGLEIVQSTRGFTGNTLLPGLNARYLERVLKATGDTLDDALVGKVPLRWQLVSPGAFWDAFTGAWRDLGHDLTLALRMPPARAVPPPS